MHRLLLGLACLLAVLAAAPAAAAPRLALVVGNAAYAGHPLATAANDAGLVAQALAQAGYDVTAARDLDGKALRAAFHAFADSARDAGPDASILVYLAGIGVQYDGGNYMLPVDAALAHDDDVPLQGADLDDFLRALAAGPAKARVFLLDLARDSPLAPTDEMPLAPGLALVTPAKDTLVGFAAAPGQVAPLAALPYGPYARALAEALGPQKADTIAPGASAMLERVRLRVATLTNGAQIPWSAGSLSSSTGPTTALDRLPGGARSPEVAFAAVLARDSFDGYADFLRAVPDGPLAARVRVLLALRREATMWRAVAGSDDPRAAWTYMRRYPRGPHRFDARRRLAALKAQLEPPPRFDPVAFPEAPPPGAAELALVAHPREAQRGLPPIPAPPEALLPPAASAYTDDLPMPTPAPRGLLPIASPLPQDAAVEPGQITQGEIVSATRIAPNGSGTLTLADEKGPFLIFATRVDSTGTRVTVETGPKGDVKSRTTTTQAGNATTIVLADPAGTALMRIAARNDPDGSRTTRVTDADGALLAAWHRDAGGIVVASETAGTPLRPAPAVSAPVAAASTSPTIAVPTLPKPPLHAAPSPPQLQAQAPVVAPAVMPVVPKPSTRPLAPALPAPPQQKPPKAPTPIAPTPAVPAASAAAVTTPAASTTPAPVSAPHPAPASVTPRAPSAQLAPPQLAPPLAIPKPAPAPSPQPEPQAPVAPPAPEVAIPPATPPAASMRVPLPPPRPAEAKPRGTAARKQAPMAKPHAKPASRPARAAPRRKGKGAR